MSALTHLGNLVVNIKDRPAYKKDGTPLRDPETGLNERVIIGSPRTYFPLREDMTLQISKLIRKSLQVPHRPSEPVKMVRYPQEEGDLKSKLLQARINWLTDSLKQPHADAKALAAEELESFFRPEGLDTQDPLGSLTEVFHMNP